MVSYQDRFLDKYYRLRGWTKEGVPTAKKLKELGLEFAAKDMS
jgi:aldehyde:ferredoxin oxidoreductase